MGRVFVNDRPLEFFESQRLELLHKDVVVAAVAHDRQSRTDLEFVSQLWVEGRRPGLAWPPSRSFRSFFRTPNGARQVWAEPVNRAASAEHVRVGLGCGQSSARGSLRNGASNPTDGVRLCIPEGRIAGTLAEN